METAEDGLEPSPSGPGEGPVGKERTSWAVPLLFFVTFGLYGLYWVWNVTKEAQTFDDERQEPHGVARYGVFAVIGAIALFVTGIIAFIATAGLEALTADPNPDTIAAAGGITMVFWGIGSLVYLVGGILMLVAMWKLWKWVSFHEAKLELDALSPGVMIGILIGAALLGWIPFVGWALAIGGPFYVYYRTQEGLNNVWRAGTEGYDPPSAGLGEGQPA